MSISMDAYLPRSGSRSKLLSFKLRRGRRGREGQSMDAYLPT